jgi:hypothetical protein
MDEMTEAEMKQLAIEKCQNIQRIKKYGQEELHGRQPCQSHQSI